MVTSTRYGSERGISDELAVQGSDGSEILRRRMKKVESRADRVQTACLPSSTFSIARLIPRPTPPTLSERGVSNRHLRTAEAHEFTFNSIAGGSMAMSAT